LAPPFAAIPDQEVCPGDLLRCFVIGRTRHRFFQRRCRHADPELAAAIDGERERQQSQIELIASENIVSQAVLMRRVRRSQQIRRGYLGAAITVAANSSISPERLAIGARPGFSAAVLRMFSRMPAPRRNETCSRPSEARRHDLGMSLAAGAT